MNSWKVQNIVMIITFSFLQNNKLRGNYILVLALKLDLWMWGNWGTNFRIRIKLLITMKLVDEASLMYGIEEYIGMRNLLCVLQTQLLSLHKYFMQFSGELFYLCVVWELLSLYLLYKSQSNRGTAEFRAELPEA